VTWLKCTQSHISRPPTRGVRMYQCGIDWAKPQ
jgi:hypothetical protein